MRVSFAGGGTDLPPFGAGVRGRVVGSAIGLRVDVLVEPFDRGWVQLESGMLRREVTRRRGESVREDVAFRLLEAALDEFTGTVIVRLVAPVRIASVPEL